MLKIVMFCFVTMMFASCTPNYGRNLDGRDYDLYDKIGYKSGSQPGDIAKKNRDSKLSNSGVRIVEDYYYRKPEAKRLPPPRKSPKRVLRVKYEPSSRFYNNPYSFKPPVQFPYFDSDQYYTPPRGAANIEFQPKYNNKLY